MQIVKQQTKHLLVAGFKFASISIKNRFNFLKRFFFKVLIKKEFHVAESCGVLAMMDVGEGTGGRGGFVGSGSDKRARHSPSY